MFAPSLWSKHGGIPVRITACSVLLAVAAVASADPQPARIPSELTASPDISASENATDPHRVMQAGPSCGVGAGDCFDPAGNGTPGCDFASCCQMVCNSMPSCCDVAWDAACAAAAAADCPPFGSENCQEPDQQNHGGSLAATSDGSSFITADNFIPSVSGVINTVSWWGVYVNFTTLTDCAPGDSPDAFSVTYYLDSGFGFPGTVHAGPFAVAPTKTATGQFLSSGIGPITEMVFTATHTDVPVDAATCYWIEIKNETTGACTWLWSVAPPGDAYAQQDAGKGYSTETQKEYDLAWCVGAALSDPTGQCNQSTPVPCTLTVTEGVTTEPEACGEDSNSGCNAFPPAFNNIVPGFLIHGTAWADGGLRDTDWYRLVTSASDDVNGNGIVQMCYEIIGEPRMSAFLIFDVFDDCTDIQFPGPIASSAFCGDVMPGSSIVELGTHYVFAGPGTSGGGGVFDGFPCGGQFGNDYTLCVQVTDDGEACPAACEELACSLTCPGDVNGDGQVNAADLASVLGQWGTPACNGFIPCCEDINGDNSVGPPDLALLLGDWGSCI